MDVIDLGIIEYKKGLEFQLDILEKRISGRTKDSLIFCEHKPVVTLGRTSDAKNIIDASYFLEEGVEVVQTSRGGKVTYHAPGQLLIYPVILLPEGRRDVSFYIDFLEKAVALALNDMGIGAIRTERRGIWASGKKIAFIGVSFRRWVTFHGVCININNDISPFASINPCGEADIKVTSVKEELGREFDMSEAKKIFCGAFEATFSESYLKPEAVI